MNCKIIRPGRLTSASKPLETVRTIDHTGLNSIPPIREQHPNGLCCAALQVHAVQTRIFS
mgnify:CR=1 FL=1